MMKPGTGGPSPAGEPRREAPPPAAAPFVHIEGLTKTYLMGDKRLEVLRGLDLDIERGELVALTGPSGAGKSTFLHLLGTLDVPTGGTVLFDGEDVFERGEEGLAAFRNETVGFVFQSHHLLPEFTALENAMMPALIRRVPRGEARRAAAEMLGLVGLGERMEHHPGELSGGEQQRVALARALCLRPRLLLADEPTGNLDPATADGIHALLAELNARMGITAVVVTHNERLASALPRRLRLEGGRLT
jgi:lipoprotein-releasing system ATP-binding protein